MNNREAIRALIPTESSKKKVAVIITELPEIPAQYVRESIGQMYRAGIIDRTGNKSVGFAYYVARAVKLKRFASDEERAAGKRATDASHNRRRRAQTQSDRVAGWAASRAERAKQREAIQAARATKAAAKREEEQRATLVAQGSKRRERAAILRAKATMTKPQRLLSNAPAKPALPNVTEAPKPRQRLESIEEWQRRTGRKPERLPAAWDQRMAA